MSVLSDLHRETPIKVSGQPVAQPENTAAVLPPFRDLGSNVSRLVGRRPDAYLGPISGLLAGLVASAVLWATMGVAVWLLFG